MRCMSAELSNYFMQYGTILDAVVMKDENGGTRRFGFVTFSETSAVDMIVAQYDDHEIDSKWVEVKRAIPREILPAGTPLGKGRGLDGLAAPLPGAGKGPDRAGDVRPGDWTCPGCGLNVFASKRSCVKCGATKPLPLGDRDGRSRSRRGSARKPKRRNGSSCSPPPSLGAATGGTWGWQPTGLDARANLGSPPRTWVGGAPDAPGGAHRTAEPHRSRGGGVRNALHFVEARP